MKENINSIEEYLKSLPENRKHIIEKLRNTILSNLPKGFSEEISYGMISYVVPLSIYPKGYHAKKNQPLPFISLASQKNHIALYHMGIYSNQKIEKWFIEEYKKIVPTKLDMGKSCIRFKNMKLIPYELIGELSKKITVEEYIEFYENMRK